MRSRIHPESLPMTCPLCLRLMKKIPSKSKFENFAKSKVMNYLDKEISKVRINYISIVLLL